MTIQNACSQLDSSLRDLKWYVCTGISQTQTGDKLIVYVSNLKPARARLMDTYEGFKVEIKSMGRPRPAYDEGEEAYKEHTSIY